MLSGSCVDEGRDDCRDISFDILDERPSGGIAGQRCAGGRTEQRERRGRECQGACRLPERGVEAVVYFARTSDVGTPLSDKGHESVLVCSGRSALYLAMGA